jgi:hypothetical protein
MQPLYRWRQAAACRPLLPQHRPAGAAWAVVDPQRISTLAHWLEPCTRKHRWYWNPLLLIHALPLLPWGRWHMSTSQHPCRLSAPHFLSCRRLPAWNT